jgi:hypothetical protein
MERKPIDATFIEADEGKHISMSDKEDLERRKNADVDVSRAAVRVTCSRMNCIFKVMNLGRL